jgi:hypothetical protein
MMLLSKAVAAATAPPATALCLQTRSLLVLVANRASSQILLNELKQFNVRLCIVVDVMIATKTGQ